MAAFAFAVVPAFWASSASAQGATASQSPPAFLNFQMSAGSTLDNLLANVRRTFRNLDANADGLLTLADARLHEAVSGAGQRTAIAAQIMQADLDGDGVVTEAELRQKRLYDQRMIEDPRDRTDPQRKATREARNEQDIKRIMAADGDKDGRVTWIEALASAGKNTMLAERLSQGLSKNVSDLLAFAKKDSLTLAEFEDLATGLFRSADADGNGTISQDEFALVSRRAEERQRAEAEAAQQRRATEARAGCTMPKASEPAKVVLLSAYQGDALSSTTIGSQDVGTGTATITVEPGSEPIYVVIAAFRPIIWRFEGAVERIEQVALSATMTGPGSSKPEAKPLVGLTGVRAERVTFLPRSNCLEFFTEAPSTKSAITAAIVRNETGKQPIVAARYAVSGFAIPSGDVRTTDRADRPTLVISKPAGTLRIEGGANVVVVAGAGDLAGEISRFYPGGLVEIDPSSVVASERPARYETLPNQAGLLQLIQRGALVRNRSGEFLIKEKIRFPAELNGAHSARFVLLRGVPAPDGNPGHSCVIVEETGTPLSGRNC